MADELSHELRRHIVEAVAGCKLVMADLTQYEQTDVIRHLVDNLPDGCVRVLYGYLTSVRARQSAAQERAKTEQLLKGF